ncbi:MAG: LysR family transcriptional regulator [Ilumatobacteraceae bacterium]
MLIRQLQTLVAIADHGSFSAAAKSLDTVQSNVSAHISRLEKHLGATLVDRTSGGLTAEGEVVLARARRIMNELEDIDGEIHSLGGSAAGECRIGTIGTTARWLMPPMLSQMSRTHADVRITVVEGATSSLLPRVASGELDAAVVHLPVSEAGLETKELFAEDLLLLVHHRHPLSSHTTITLAELAEHPILLAPLGTAQRRIVDRAAGARGVALKTQAEIDGVRLMTSLAFDGYGPAIVPASAIPVWLSGDFTRIAVPELPRRVVGWTQRTRPAPTRATLAVRDAAFASVERHGSRQPGVSVDISPRAARF